MMVMMIAARLMVGAWHGMARHGMAWHGMACGLQVRIEALQRMRAARNGFVAKLSEAREQAKMENKLAELQRKLQEAEQAQNKMVGNGM